jgi:hypothetical protein
MVEWKTVAIVGKWKVVDGWMENGGGYSGKMEGC